MKKENSTNSQKYSGIAEQMIKMPSNCPKITKFILDIIYRDEGKGNGISTVNKTAKRLRNSGQKRLRKNQYRIIIHQSVMRVHWRLERLKYFMDKFKKA